MHQTICAHVSRSIDPAARFTETDVQHTVFQKWPLIVYR